MQGWYEHHASCLVGQVLHGVCTRAGWLRVPCSLYVDVNQVGVVEKLEGGLDSL